MISRKLTIICLITILAIFTLPFTGLASDAPKVILNGETLALDVPPQIFDGRTFVPMRTIFEALGAQIHWDPNTKTVTATKDSLEIVLKVGDSNAYINNEKVKVDAPAKIVSGRTLVPLRFVSEAMNSTVNWDGNTKTVTITRKGMTPEEAIKLFRARLEEVGITVVDSGFGISLDHYDELDIVLDGVKYYCIRFTERYGSWGGMGFYAVNPITGEIHQIMPSGDDDGYEYIRDLTSDEAFREHFGY